MKDGQQMFSRVGQLSLTSLRILISGFGGKGCFLAGIVIFSWKISFGGRNWGFGKMSKSRRYILNMIS